MLKECKVFDLVSVPEGKKAIRNRWVFNIKPDGRKCAPKALVLGHCNRDIQAAHEHPVPETHLDDSFNPLARFYPLGSYTPTVPCN